MKERDKRLREKRLKSAQDRENINAGKIDYQLMRFDGSAAIKVFCTHCNAHVFVRHFGYGSEAKIDEQGLCDANEAAYIRNKECRRSCKLKVMVWSSDRGSNS